MTSDTGLFQVGDFSLHSGLKSDFLINCEALTEADLRALAALVVNGLPDFGAVEGVPRGGLRFAAAIAGAATRDERDPLLIVDDVYTTGASMEAHRAGRRAMGVVIFAREPVTHRWVVPLFTRAWMYQLHRLQPTGAGVPGDEARASRAGRSLYP